jgi:hypothetical protein
LGEIGFCRAFEAGVEERERGGATTGRPLHLLDMMQGAFDEAMPVAISAQGGTPRAMLATYRYPGFVASYERRAANGGRGVSFHGSRATLMVNRAGCFLFPLRANTRPVAERSRQLADVRVTHWRNFLECIRSRRRPASDIETCVRSATTCLLSDLALRRGVTLDWDEKAFTVKEDDIKQYLTSRHRSPWKLEV